MNHAERIDAELWLKKARETIAASEQGRPILGAHVGEPGYYPTITGVLLAVTAGLADGLQKALELQV